MYIINIQIVPICVYTNEISVDPLFDQFDIIVDNFTNCGFLGEAYGNFKEAGCVNLFDDWYKIARALAIIAYFSILIVFLSMCMDYIYGPVKKRLPSDMDDEIALAEMNNDETGGVELVTPYGTKPHFSDDQPDNYNPHRQSAYNFDDAPASVNGNANRALSVASNSTGYPSGQPAPPSEPPPGSSYGTVGAIAVSYPPKPEVAESSVQDYSINYDNDPSAPPAGGLDVIQQGDEPNDDDNDNDDNNDGDGMATTGNYEEPVVPDGNEPGGDGPGAVVLNDDGAVLKDSSDEDDGSEKL